jgi:hypothetical protein
MLSLSACATTSATRSFWDQVVVITSKDSNITKAYGRYLESRLISLAAEAAA